MTLLKPDICVIGAGSGGLTVAAGAARMGARVVLIEGAEMGGDCLNHGCVPSKALFAAARHAHAMTTGAPFGVRPVDPTVDFAAVKDHVARTIAGIAPHDSVERFEGLGVTVLREWARFASPTCVETDTHTIEARRFVVATGSRPFVPPIPGLDTTPYFTNETIFALRERPSHLLVLGGGPIGMEMAQAHRRLGSNVTIVEAARALSREDPELAGVALDALREEGVVVREGVAVEAVASGPSGIRLETGQGTLTGSHLLVAVGRRPELSRLLLDQGNIRATGKGVDVDGGLRSTTNRRVYAIGDAAGGAQFTHLAGHHGSLVIRSALFGLRVSVRPEHVPRVTYTDPEIAQVGLTEGEARAAFGNGIEVLRVPLAELDRARTDGVIGGLVKVVVRRGRPIGAGIVGPGAGELIGLWQLALANRLKIAAIASMIAPYPTLGEASKRAAGEYYAPRLFESDRVKRLVRLIQRWVP